MPKPVVLAHGGMTGPWEWDAVVPLLRAEGIEVETVDLPSRDATGSLAADEAAVRAVLDTLSAPAVLVGHSYSGMVITGASVDNPSVAHLVYVCAALPQQGQTLEAVTARLDSDRVVDEPAADDSDELDGFRRAVCNDADAEEWAFIRDRLGAMAPGIRTELPSGLGWQQHPSSYVVCTLDRTFPPALQRRLAASTGESIELEAAHMPMVTQAARLAAIIADVALSRPAG